MYPSKIAEKEPIQSSVSPVSSEDPIQPSIGKIVQMFQKDFHPHLFPCEVWAIADFAKNSEGASI